VWDDDLRAAPEEWVWKWEHALTECDRAIDWSRIKPETIELELELLEEELSEATDLEDDA